MTHRPSQIHLLSPAKINLFLQVTGKRPDGYHNLLSLMCCIGLYDEMTLQPGLTKTTVTCSHPDVPEDATNLAVRAARVFLETFNVSDGVGIEIEKKIPVGGGLGGGSSNAASVLAALNRYYGTPFSTDELLAMGLSIGADVPFFIHGKPAMVSGIGETIEPFVGLSTRPVVLIFPGTGVSTGAVYKNLNLALTKCKNTHIQSDLSNREFNVSRDLCNDLESVAASRCPEILTAKQSLIDCGADGALMSGSGSSVFGLFPDGGTAKGAREILLRHEKWVVFLVEMLV